MILLHPWWKEVQQRSKKIGMRKAPVQEKKEMKWSPSTVKKKDGRKLQLWTEGEWQNPPI